jgi:hypothetical protein
MSEETASDKNVEIWKVKKLIKSLQLARGNGTSMISLIIPPGDQVNKKQKKSIVIASWLNGYSRSCLVINGLSHVRFISYY